MERTELDKLAPALVALQADLTPVAKTADNPFFKSAYAPLPEVMKSVQPLLAKHKLAVSQFVTHLNGESALRTILVHESGQYIEDIAPLLLAKQDPQGQGSAISYARRYGVMAVLGLVADEDDDGNSASHPQKLRSTPPKKWDGDSVAKGPATHGSSRPVTENQIGLISILGERKGKSDEWIKQTLAKVHTTADASAVIDRLNDLGDM